MKHFFRLLLFAFPLNAFMMGYAFSATVSILTPSEAQDYLLITAWGSRTTIDMRCVNPSFTSSEVIFQLRPDGGSFYDILCDGTVYRYNKNPVLAASAALKVINSSKTSVSAILQIKYAQDAWSVAPSKTVTAEPARSCSVTLPDAINLGSLQADRIKNGISSDQKININGECNTNFTLTFANGNNVEGNFLLGNDVAMRLSYNYGANRIVNGQPFTPALSQIVDIDLMPVITGVAPTAGTKTTTLTATLNLL